MRRFLLTIVMTPLLSAAIQAADYTDLRLTKTAEQWGLSEAEYRQSQSIMAGPRGTWSPAIDPIMALGVSAETSEERRRYAELYVRQEYARVERELAFQREINAAWARLFPGHPRLEAPAKLERYAVVIDAREDNNALINDYTTRGEAGVDIYLVGTDQLAEWGHTAGIAADKIRSGRVRIKRGAPFADLPRLPVIFIKREGQAWVPQA